MAVLCSVMAAVLTRSSCWDCLMYAFPWANTAGKAEHSKAGASTADEAACQLAKWEPSKVPCMPCCPVHAPLCSIAPVCKRLSESGAAGRVVLAEVLRRVDAGFHRSGKQVRSQAERALGLVKMELAQRLGDPCSTAVSQVQAQGLGRAACLRSPVCSRGAAC